jgi:hypothetical protein
MHLAAWAGQRQCATLLLTHGAHVGSANREGWTPLHFAAACGDAALVRSPPPGMLSTKELPSVTVTRAGTLPAGHYQRYLYVLNKGLVCIATQLLVGFSFRGTLSCVVMIVSGL